jgi:site-specific recombinase
MNPAPPFQSNEVTQVEPTRNLVIALFPAPQQTHPSLQQLADLAEVFTRAGTLRLRLDALVCLYEWLRQKDNDIPEPPAGIGAAAESYQGAERRRERVWFAILARSPELRDRCHAGIAAILEETNGVSLFAHAGLPTDRGLLHEAFDRLLRTVLPTPREETELAKLVVRLFPTQKEVDRFFSLPSDELERIVRLITPIEHPEAWERVQESLLDSFYLLAARVQGLGLSEKLRIRGQGGRVRESPFCRLTQSAVALLESLRTKENTAQTAQAWKSTVAECRAELQVIVSHLDARGVNLDIVYAMDVIEQSLKRMEIIGGVLVAQSGAPKTGTSLRLLREVIRGRLHDSSLWDLAQNSSRLLARKIVEWAGKTGEHYVTCNREEYRQMWKAALGGGLLTVGTAAIKLMVTHRGLPLFVEGFLAGLNYAISFVLMHVFHLALATKQPSMTGATLAGILHSQGVSRTNELTAYVQRIVRSQLAAALGNIVAVTAGAIVFSMLWRWVFGAPFLSPETADYAVNSMNPLRTGTIFFAALTGVILWLSSLAGGWIENWAVYHQLPRAIAEHRLGASFKPESVQRVSESFARNVAPWGSSIVLGFMLGMAPSIGHFFGLPLDVRHVTLSTGTLALGAASRGLEGMGEGALLWACLGITVTFAMNLGVSFYLALVMALRAQDVSRDDYFEILHALWKRLWTTPLQFFFPPPDEVAPAAEPAP